MDLTYNFTPGTKAVAQQVNQNFADVKSAIDPLETAVADIESQLTSGIILPDGSIDFTRLQSYATYVVSNATNATPIVLTCLNHGRTTGEVFRFEGIGGNTAANGKFTITVIDNNTISLDNSVGNGTYTSGGIGYLVPQNPENFATIGDTTNIIDGETTNTLNAVHIMTEAEFEVSEHPATNLECVPLTSTPLDYYNGVTVAINTEYTPTLDGVLLISGTTASTFTLKVDADVTKTMGGFYLPVFVGQTITSTVAGVFYPYQGQ